MSSKQVIINSVVLLGISDHHTRNTVQKKQQRIVGGLMGKKTGAQVTINSCFEMAYELDKDGEIKDIDKQHLEKKVKLIKTDDPFNHFKNDEFVGWYSSTPNSRYCKQDIHVHDKVTKSLNKMLGDTGDEEAKNQDNKGGEEALYLAISLDQKILTNPNVKEVPITLYKRTDQQNQLAFQQVQHLVNAEKGEIISIESASQAQGGTQSQFAEKMQSTLNAVNRYNEKIEGLVQALDNPSIGKNLILMRELKGILNSYPQQFQGSLDQKMLEQYSDSNIISFLAGISSVNRVVSDVYQSNSSLKNANVKGHMRNDIMM